MGRALDISAMLQLATPATRREILRIGAAGGIAAPALLAMLARDGVAPVYAAANLQETPVKGGTLVLLGHQEIASLHPDEAIDGPTVHWVMVTQMFNALVEQDENFVFQPVLAEALPTVSEDGLTYTFKLRTGVKFHNGEELTSADVKYTYEWFMNPDNAATNAANFASVASVEAPDPSTVVVTLKEPFALFLARVGGTFIMPAADHEAKGKEGFGAAPVGTGAFKLKEWNAAAFTETERFDEHFRGAPNLDAVRLNVVPEPAQRTIGLETGEADASVWTLVTEDHLRLSEDDRFKTYVTSSLAINHFPLNNTNPKLSDKRVRQAMMFAIDRQSIIDDIWQGTATLATANLSPALSQFYNADVPQYPYDPAKAAALLDEAGWVLNGDWREKDGETLSFTCTTITGDSTRRGEAEIVQQFLAEVGIQMNLEEAPVATILEQMRAGTMDSSVFNWTYGGGFGDPDDGGTLESTGASNFSHFSNARVDELLAQGRTEIDPAARVAIYNEVQQIFADEVPFLFMMFWDWYTFINTRVKGVPESAQTADAIYTNAYKWWIQE
ncbi:MAG: ABC transporter substrate-binding protein [Phycisphaerales bacterium]|nr:ABC transporter substrate-binding protein [Phycisphaerales bacterium]